MKPLANTPEWIKLFLLPAFLLIKLNSYSQVAEASVPKGYYIEFCSSFNDSAWCSYSDDSVSVPRKRDSIFARTNWSIEADDKNFFIYPSAPKDMYFILKVAGIPKRLTITLPPTDKFKYIEIFKAGTVLYYRMSDKLALRE
jgi:hypothetical protein